MGTIVGMSGGYTEPVERFIIELANKKQPKVLLIPTASGDSPMCIMSFYNDYFLKYGCKVDVLALTYNNLSGDDIQKKILSADIISVGGGSAYHMLEMWRKFKVDEHIREAYKRDIILSGTSAGAICWFKYGNGDSNFYRDGKVLKYRRVIGSGCVNTICFPHYYTDADLYFEKIMKFYDVPAIALNDNASIFIKDDKYIILRTGENAKAYKFANKEGIITKRSIIKEEMMPLKDLL